MSKLAGLMGTQAVVIAGGIAGIVAVSVVTMLLNSGAQDTAVTAPSSAEKPNVGAQDDSAQPAAPSNEPTTAPTAMQDRGATNDAVAIAGSQSDTADVPTPAPTFDLVRVDGDGAALVAGRAAPNSRVTILIGDKVVGNADVSADGTFSQFLDLTPASTVQVMRLVMAREGEADIASVDQVILTPDMQSVAVTEGDADTSDARIGAAVIDENAPRAPAVLLATEQGIKVLQPAAIRDAAPEIMSTVALDTISYSKTGEVKLAGRAQSGGFVRVYLDNTPITTSRISDTGQWGSDLPDVDSGIYTLRVDQVDGDGVVMSRVETPFKREAAETIAQNNTTVRAITVQPGSTLWAIAHERYGDGQLYVRLFEANRERIRNPNLIYPGQVFDIPVK